MWLIIFLVALISFPYAQPNAADDIIPSNELSFADTNEFSTTTEAITTNTATFESETSPMIEFLTTDSITTNNATFESEIVVTDSSTLIDDITTTTKKNSATNHRILNLFIFVIIIPIVI
jgi:hypothetical protein